MSGEIQDFDLETKKLVLEIKENEARYISGELNLEDPLQRTDQLYELAYAKAEKTTANNVLQDSGLMQLHSKIIRQKAKSYKPDTLVFDPRSFSVKLKSFYTPMSTAADDTKTSNKIYSMIWQKLGEESRKNMHITPTFNFLYGTFTADPVSPAKKKRKRIEKEKVPEAVKPKTVAISESSEGKDEMLNRVQRINSILYKYSKKRPSICYYEFVIDPQSFMRTIDNIFNVSLLVQNGYACIFPDEQGLPCIRHVSEAEKKERLISTIDRIQSVISMSVVEWKAIIDKFKFTRCLIPPPKPKKD